MDYRFIGNNFFPVTPYDFQDKTRSVMDYIGYMMNRCQSMFRWGHLPYTIPARNLELMMQTNGNVCWAKVNGELYVFTGGLGGEPDEYYMPTIYTIANPALKYSANLKIGEECVVMPNDSLYMGLIPMHRRYATILAECDISLRLATINTRATSLISAQDDRTLKSAEKYVEQLEDGDIAIVGETAFLDGVRVQPYSDNSAGQNIINLIEMKNSSLAAWLNEMGLDSNTNLKREYVSDSELELTADALLPLIDDMLRCRLRAVKEINEMFGTDIEVALNSAWEDNQTQVAITNGEIPSEPVESDNEDNGNNDDKYEDNKEIINEDNDEQNEQAETRAEEIEEEVDEEQMTEEETNEVLENNKEEDDDNEN